MTERPLQKSHPVQASNSKSLRCNWSFYFPISQPSQLMAFFPFYAMTVLLQRKRRICLQLHPRCEDKILFQKLLGGLLKKLYSVDSLASTIFLTSTLFIRNVFEIQIQIIINRIEDTITTMHLLQPLFSGWRYILLQKHHIFNVKNIKYTPKRKITYITPPPQK